MSPTFTKLIIICSLLNCIHGTYPPVGYYIHRNVTRYDVFQVEYRVTFNQGWPHMVYTLLNCWSDTTLEGWFSLKDFDVPEGCSLDLKDRDDRRHWTTITQTCNATATYMGHPMQPDDLKTLITKKDAGGRPYIELSFSKTKLKLLKYH
ncbi:hypothetical protein FOL47_009218 [Perkinsus chesapeaki]|uniref:Uncharacterized protein n=1 Tax=Perkinsus chesapeaki TaxID=330153 RepID=A0A7J6L9N8_PERCH|nr:hypothetical protein FOL47_009218 [Perkinsus chesapeaki]